jgi:hypothetical protein
MKIIPAINLKVRLIRNLRKDSSRLINAIGFLRHIVSGGFVGPGPAAAADLSELTPSALSFIAFGVPEILEDFASGPDLMERLFQHIPTAQLQVAAGLNLAGMRDKTERDSAQASPGGRIEAVGL